MGADNRELQQREQLKPVELSSWALAAFGMLIVWWLPIGQNSQRVLFALLTAFCLYVFVYFHWLVSRLLDSEWMNLVPMVANIAMLTGVHYLVGESVNVEVIYILIIVNAAARLGTRLAMVAAALSGVSVFLVEIGRSGPSSAVVISFSATLLVFLVAGYLSGSLTSSTRRQVQRMGVLNEVAHATGSTIEMGDLLELMYQQLRRVIPTDTYYVGLHEPNSDYIDLQIIFDEGKHFPPQKVSFGDGLASLVVKSGKPMLIRRLSKEMDSLPTKMVVVGRAKSSESWLGVPLLMNDEFSGVMVVASYKPNAFDEGDVELLGNIAGQVALALDNARHHAQVEEQARRDSLTGAYNHGYFLKRLYEETRRASKHGRPTSLIMVDIDYFKDYNDRFGHVRGDQVLRRTVQAIEEHVKKGDAVGRWGGEEFGIVLQDATTEQARGVADRIRLTLAAMPLLDGNGGTIPNPTVSQGIATFPDHVADADKLVDMADAMLYQAKEQGRGQVRVAPRV